MYQVPKKSVRALCLAVAACTATALTACGSSSDDSKASGAAPSGKKDAALAKQVPAKYRDGFTVAVQSSQPPEAYLESGRAVGISPDLVRAVGTVLGVKIKIDSTTFENELLGVSAGRYGFVTDTNITTERAKIYDQFAYYVTAYRFVRLSSTKPLGNSFTDLCGKTTGNQGGDVSIPVIEERSKADCVAKGKAPIKIVQSPSQASALLAMQSGRVEAVARPLDSAVYASKQPGGKGTTIDGPYFLKGLVGASFPKGSTLLPVVMKAMSKLVQNGTYAKIMAKYGYAKNVQVTKFQVNPAPLADK